MYRHFFKRLLDIVLSLLGIIVLAIPMLIIAIIVKCTSKGPAIFVQSRVGRNGKPFKFYKFRSMRVDAPKDCAPRLLHSEEYITKVGGFLRKTSLDELPQLFCIFTGGMSIIGPRPCGFSEEDLIQARKESGALAVRPGLTGLAQVKARDKLTDMSLKAEIDGEYAKKITFWKDLKIFFKTIAVVLKRDNVVEGTAVEESVLNEEKTENAQTDEVAVSEQETNAKE